MQFISFFFIVILGVLFWLSRNTENSVKLELIGLGVLVLLMTALWSVGMTGKKRQHDVAVPGAMQVMNQRWKDVVQSMPDVYRGPQWSAQDHKRIEEAARDYAEVWKSDPYAYARIKSHMKQGFEEYHWIASQARIVLNQRAAAQYVKAKVQA